MIVYGELNKISAGLQKEIPALKPGEQFEYKLLGIRPDPENPGHFIVPSMVSVPSRFMISDGDGVAEVAFVTRIESKSTDKGRQDSPKIPPIFFTREEGGTMVLSGNNPEHRQLHEYLFLCPLNESSPCRIQDVEPRYRFVDLKAEAKKGMEVFSRKMDAMTFIGNLTPTKGLYDYAFLISGVETKDQGVAKFQLANYAEKDPEQFFAIVESVDARIKVTYLRALNSGIINYDAKTGAIKWNQGGDMLCSISTATSDRPGAFLIWAKASAQNMKIVETMEALLQKNVKDK